MKDMNNEVIWGGTLPN